MKFRNKKDMPEANSPYEKAQGEWSARIGNAKSQVFNWQMIALGSVIVSILLLIALIIISGKQKEYVYVAQVAPNENVVNTVSLSQRITPTQAQKAYFVAQFINQIMTLPLDPVVLLATIGWLHIVKCQAKQ
jgi:type IV secretion system protein TrbF